MKTLNTIKKELIAKAKKQGIWENYDIIAFSNWAGTFNA